MLAVILIILGLILISAALFEREKAAVLSEELLKITDNADIFDAQILDVRKEKVMLKSGREKNIRVMIVQFRIESRKSTVIHRLTDKFYRSYQKGENIKIFFIEGEKSDRAIVAEDNIYLELPKRAKRYFTPTAVIGIGFIIAGILTFII